MTSMRVFVIALCACFGAQAISEEESFNREIADYVQYSVSHPLTFWQAIVPGTKWCGDGDIAENEDDLGFFKATDKCCRAHDLCDDIIFAGESKHGLVNDGQFTRLHCKCDRAFYDCLKKVKMPLSVVVGTGYFNVLGGQCYANAPPATCVEYESIVGLRERCVEYEFDNTQPKLWQWLDVPRFT